MLRGIMTRASVRFFIVGAIIAVSVGFIGCREQEKLDSISKSVIFTDRRGYDQKIIDEDIRTLTQSINSDPNNATLYLARGFVYAAIHEYVKAVPDFQKAESLNNSIDIPAVNTPHFGAPSYLLGLAYWQKGDLREALECLSEAISLDPQYAGSYYYRGMVYWKMGDKSAAIQDIAKACNLEKDNQRNKLCQDTLAEMQGKRVSSERIFGSFITCFLSNRPPQSRPFGYSWQVIHEVR